MGFRTLVTELEGVIDKAGQEGHPSALDLKQVFALPTLRLVLHKAYKDSTHFLTRGRVNRTIKRLMTKVCRDGEETECAAQMVAMLKHLLEVMQHQADRDDPEIARWGQAAKELQQAPRACAALMRALSHVDDEALASFVCASVHKSLSECNERGFPVAPYSGA